MGYVLITYGVIDAICSASFGGFIKYVGRVPIFLGGACLNLICVIVLFVWEPSPDMSYLFFIIAGLWGAADAVWQTQINGKIGVYFRCWRESPKKPFKFSTLLILQPYTEFSLRAMKKPPFPTTGSGNPWASFLLTSCRPKCAFIQNCG